MNGRAATAPCGHPGEVVIGTYVKCLQGCDDKPKGVAKPAAPKLPHMTVGQARAHKPYGFDAAERAWFDKQMVNVRTYASAKATSTARAGAIVVPENTDPNAAVAHHFQYLQQPGRNQCTTPVNSTGVAYTYAVPEIRAAMLAGVVLDPHKAQLAAQTLVDEWVGRVWTSFLHEQPAAVTKVSPWGTRNWSSVGLDLVDSVRRVAMHRHLSPSRRVIDVFLPIPAYNYLASSRMPASQDTVLEHIKATCSWLKSIEPLWRLKDRMVTAYVDPSVMECLVPMKFEQGKVNEVVGPGGTVTSYRVVCHARRADDVILYDSRAIDYVDGVWA